MRTKKELKLILDHLEILSRIDNLEELKRELSARMNSLQEEMETAPEDFLDHVMESHKTLCKVKGMGLKDAYGQNPFLYYSCGLAGEAGEICNKMAKSFRSGFRFELAQEAVRSELPDVFIYGAILAYVSEIDLFKEINIKVDEVVQRALDGYYGGPLEESSDRSR